MSFKNSSLDDYEIARRQSLLVQKIRGMNLTVFKVRSDGNCFYRALAVSLSGDQEDHSTVRQSIADHVEQRGNILNGVIHADADTFDNYITALRTSENFDYVGEETAQAATNIYGREVYIHSALMLPRVFYPPTPAHLPAIHLAFVEPAHYEALLPTAVLREASHLNA